MSEEEQGNKEEPREWEEEARRMGWIPEDEYNGNPDFWKGAEEFVKHGEQELPILRERLKTLNSKFAKQETTMKAFSDHYNKVEERAYNRAVKTLKDEQSQAVEDGDSTKFLKIQSEIDNLEKPRPVTVAASDNQSDPPELAPEYIEWHGKNTWYGQDMELSTYADAIAVFIQNTNPTLKGKGFFDEIRKQVKDKYPDKFSNSNRNAPPVVGSGTITNEGGGGKKSYSNLPADAKKACDDFIKQGLLTKEQYVKDYFGEE